MLHDEKVQVMFQPLSKEPFYKFLIRWIVRKRRDNEYIVVTVNGKTVTMPRGVVVEAPFYVVQTIVANMQYFDTTFDCFVNVSKALPDGYTWITGKGV